MTRRLHHCLTCEVGDTPFTRKRGFTRHKGGVCGWCRRRGVTVKNDTITVPIVVHYRGHDTPLRPPPGPPRRRRRRRLVPGLRRWLRVYDRDRDLHAKDCD